MATADKLTEHYLTCIICAEVFKDPATLHCDHTFCRPCLLKYIKTQSDAMKAKSIPCPSFKQMTRVTSPDKAVEDWVNQVKLSRIMMGLMEDFGPGTENNARIIQESLCDNCLKMHRRVSLTREHQVTSLTGESKPFRRSRFRCSEHTEEQVKFFCKDCKKAICQTCCNISHRQCKTVVTMESMMSDVTTKLETELDVTRKIIEEKTETVCAQKTQVEEITTNCRDIVLEIKEASQLLVDMIKKKEKELLDEVTTLKEDHITEVKAGMKSEEIDIQMHHQQIEFIDRAVKFGCHKDMFASYEYCGDVTDDTYKKENKRPPVGNINFIHDIRNVTKVASQVQLGHIEDLWSVAYLTSSAVLHNTFDFRMNEDGKMPDLMDVSVLSLPDGNIIVVSDYNNNTVKAYFSLESRCYKRALEVPKYPWQLAKITQNEVVVSCFNKTIVFVKFDTDPHVTVKTSTSKQFYGLACLTPIKLVAGSGSHVVLFDAAGNVLKTIAGRTREPDYITVAKNGNLLVSDNTPTSILSVTSDGKVNFTYSPTGDKALTCPRGITTTDSGDILFADRDSNKVIQLTVKGQFVRDLLTEEDELIDPQGLCVDEGGLLYVTTRQFVKVFKFV